MNDTPPPLPWERPTSTPLTPAPRADAGQKSTSPFVFFHDIFHSPAKAIWVVGAILAILLMFQKSGSTNSSSAAPVPAINFDATPYRDTQQSQRQFWRDYGN